MKSTHAIDLRERHRRIAEAAYYRAQSRGFSGGDPVADWIDAEREVDAQLRRTEHHRLLEQLEEQLATAGKRLRSLQRKVAGATVEGRKEVEKDINKIKELRGSFEKRLDELRTQGEAASHKARQHADALWHEISAMLDRLGSRKR